MPAVTAEAWNPKDRVVQSAWAGLAILVGATLATPAAADQSRPLPPILVPDLEPATPPSTPVKRPAGRSGRPLASPNGPPLESLGLGTLFSRFRDPTVSSSARFRTPDADRVANARQGLRMPADIADPVLPTPTRFSAAAADTRPRASAVIAIPRSRGSVDPRSERPASPAIGGRRFASALPSDPPPQPRSSAPVAPGPAQRSGIDRAAETSAPVPHLPVEPVWSVGFDRDSAALPVASARDLDLAAATAQSGAGTVLIAMPVPDTAERTLAFAKVRARTIADAFLQRRIPADRIRVEAVLSPGPRSGTLAEIRIESLGQ